MSGLEKLWDFLILGFGVIMLINVSIGGFEFEYGAWGYLAAFACIGYGLFRIFRMWKSRGP